MTMAKHRNRLYIIFIRRLSTKERGVIGECYIIVGDKCRADAVERRIADVLRIDFIIYCAHHHCLH